VSADAELQIELKKFDERVKEFKTQAAGISKENATIKNSNKVLKLGSEIRAQISGVIRTLTKKWKDAALNKKPKELVDLRNEISKEEQKIVNILSQIVTPDDLRNEANKNDAIIADQLKLTQNIKPLEKVRGLNNCGNTCFMNGIFQALFHTPELNRLLQLTLNDIPFAHNITKEASLLKILQKVFLDYMEFDYEETKNISVSPQDLATARLRFFPQFRQGAQDDAFEFLSALISRLGEELNVAQKLRITLSDKNKEKLEIVKNFNKAGGSEYSLLDRWFGGYDKSVTTRDDNSKLTNFNPIKFLTLSFPSDKKEPLKLDDMYESYSKLEELHGSPGNKERVYTIQRSPQNLIVQLKRFSQNDDMTFTKIESKVDYPLEWKLKTEEGSIDYELYAVVLHRGDLASGHYWANVKVGNNWFDANDSSIEKIAAPEVVSESNKSKAYLLFYRKK